MSRRAAVLRDVLQERASQDAPWGEQSHPDGTGEYGTEQAEALAKQACTEAVIDGTLTWSLILNEEVAEALAEADPVKLRAELIQVAAVAAAWVECIDRRGSR